MTGDGWCVKGVWRHLILINYVYMGRVQVCVSTQQQPALAVSRAFLSCMKALADLLHAILSRHAMPCHAARAGDISAACSCRQGRHPPPTLTPAAAGSSRIRISTSSRGQGQCGATAHLPLHPGWWGHTAATRAHQRQQNRWASGGSDGCWFSGLVGGGEGGREGVQGAGEAPPSNTSLVCLLMRAHLCVLAPCRLLRFPVGRWCRLQWCECWQWSDGVAAHGGLCSAADVPAHQPH